MASDDLVSQSFSRAFNQLHQLFEEDRLDECVEGAQKLLEETALPRYHRIKTLVLLASAVEEWHDSDRCRAEAEMLWHASRRFHPEGEDPSIDTNLADLRVTLDSLNESLKADEPTADDDEVMEEEGIDVLEDPEELAKAEEDDPEELAAADMAALAETTEEKLKIDEPGRVNVSERAKGPFKPPQTVKPEGSEAAPRAGEKYVAPALRNKKSAMDLSSWRRKE